MLLTEVGWRVAAVSSIGRGVLIGLRQEVWEGKDEGTYSQEEAPYADHPGAIHPAAKVADKDDEGSIADLIQAGNETRGRTGEPKALLDCGEAALEVGAVKELAELQEAMAQHEHLNVAEDRARAACGWDRGGAAALAGSGIGQESHGDSGVFVPWPGRGGDKLGLFGAAGVGSPVMRSTARRLSQGVSAQKFL